MLLRTPSEHYSVTRQTPDRLQPSFISKGHMPVLAHDKMIQHPNPEELTRLHEPFGQSAVFLAWGGITGGVVMRKQNGRSIHRDRGFKGLSGMHDREREASDGHNLVADRCVLHIEEQHEKFFMWSSIEVGPEEPAHLARLREPWGAIQGRMRFFHDVQSIERNTYRGRSLLVQVVWYNLLCHVLAFPLGVMHGQGVGTGAPVPTPVFLSTVKSFP